MKRAAFLALPLLLAAAAPASAGRSADARRELVRWIGSVTPRRGVHYQDLVVVPLVPIDAPGSGGPDAEPFTWRMSAQPGRERVVLLEPEEGEGAGVRLWPSGRVLREGTDERLTTHPLRLSGASSRAATVPLTPETARPSAAEDAPRTIGEVAPLVFRHTLFASNEPEEALTDLLGLGGALFGIDAREVPVGLAELEAAPRAQETLDAAKAALAPLPAAYGGAVQGHVVWMGNHAVEVALAPSPTVYREVAGVEGLALSWAVWAELYGRGALPVEDPDWRKLLAATEDVLEALEEPALRSERVPDRRPEAARLWTVRAQFQARSVAADCGWFLSDEDGRPLLLEVWPRGARGPLPPRALEPGGVPVDEDPYDRRAGALTKYFVDRFLSRFGRGRGALPR